MRAKIFFLIASVGLVGAATASEVRLGDLELDWLTAGGIADSLQNGVSLGDSAFSGPVSQSLLGGSNSRPDPTPVPTPTPSPEPNLGGSTAIAQLPIFTGSGEANTNTATSTSFIPGVSGSALASSGGTISGQGQLALQSVSSNVFVIDNR